jgi:hypothetical protein
MTLPVPNEFDAIVIGSGPAGATIARELTKQNKSVLVLERGGGAPLKEGFLSTASLLSAVKVGEKLATTTAFTTGGSTAVYFAVADPPPFEIFQSHDIDLTSVHEEVKREVPLAVLPDQLLGRQAIKVRNSAIELGYPWKKRTMFVDLAKCKTGYKYESKWTARAFVDDAVAQGATLINRARALKVLSDGNRATGVEYRVQIAKKQFEIRRAYGAKIILSAGSTASPIVLRDSGVRNIAGRGFYCHPSFVLFGTVPGLGAGETFVASEGADLEDDIFLGDANLGRTLYRMFMLGSGRILRAFAHSRSVGVGVIVKEGIGGKLDESGYSKELDPRDVRKLARGEQMARHIIHNAGGKTKTSKPN